ncbi:MAG: CPBP family glutamic-type intramembrane protease [Bacteroidota bacterium]
MSSLPSSTSLPSGPTPPTPVPHTYASLTRTATYSFLAALPLLVLYEVGALLVNADRAFAIRVGADVWIKQFLASLGATGHLALAGVVLLIGIAVFVWERKKRLPLRPRYFAGMLLESTVWGVLLATLISGTVGVLFNGALLGLPQAAEPGTATMLVLSLGAGLYEELVFRVLLVGGLYLLARRVLGAERVAAYVSAALLGALLFSAVHYTGPYADPLELPSFTFRFLFGLALNALFLVRGFGIAAWTHALYDVMVVGFWS